MRLLITTQIVDTTDAGLGFFHRWIELFAHECESVQVICLKEGVHVLPSNVTVTSLGKERGVPRAMRVLRFWYTIWRARRAYDAVLVHMNPEYVVAGGLVWRFLGKRVSLWYAHRSVNLKLRIALRLAHRVFTGSIESFRIASPKVLVTGQGVDTTQFAPRGVPDAHSGPRLLVVGRIAPIKNLELAVDTAILVQQVLPHTTLRIVGAIGKAEDARYLEHLTQYIVERHASSYITLVGGMGAHGVQEELQTADVFLHTSLTNSADKTAVEAMATGVYQVTSSPVYRKDLPSQCFQPPEAPAYAAEIQRYLELPLSERIRLATMMREAAVREHSLERLVKLIVATLQT